MTTKPLKEILPKELFACFRYSLIINTSNNNPTDEEVEKYIYALLDTSDQDKKERKRISQ